MLQEPPNKEIAVKQKINKTVSNTVLTQREIEVLHSLKKGYYYHEVGSELCISAETVKKHLKHIYTKLEVRNKTEALNKHFN